MSLSLTYQHVNKIFGEQSKNPVHALKDVSFTIEPGTETLSLTADPRSDGLVKSRTGDTTDKTAYDNWYKAVYVPDEEVA